MDLEGINYSKVCCEIGLITFSRFPSFRLIKVNFLCKANVGIFVIITTHINKEEEKKTNRCNLIRYTYTQYCTAINTECDVSEDGQESKHFC